MNVGENKIIFSTSDKSFCLFNTGTRLAFGDASAKGINVKNLLVSDAWADNINVPTNGIYVKGKISSAVTTGTPPFSIASTTKVENLNADMVDGLHESDLMVYDGHILKSKGKMHRGFGYGYIQGENPESLLKTTGPVLGFGHNNTLFKLINGDHNKNNLYLNTISEDKPLGWREFAFTDSTVEAANKLSSSHTIWGQGFDGSSNIEGALTGVTNINNVISEISQNQGGKARLSIVDRAASLDHIHISCKDATDTARYRPLVFQLGDGAVGIGTEDFSEKLNVAGNIKTTGRIIEGYRITNKTNDIHGSIKLNILNVDYNGTISLQDNVPAGCECQVIINNTGSEKITIKIPDTFKTNGVDSISIEPGNFGEINILSDGTNMYVRVA